MAAFTRFVCLLCFAYSAAELSETTTPATTDVASRELTDAGYVIRYNDRLYAYPLRTSPLFIRSPDKAPPESNAIDDDDSKRPLFYFTAYDPEQPSALKRLPDSRPYIEIRRKRDLDAEQVPDSSKVGKLRRKRTYCNKCGGGGHGGYGGYYVPVTYAVYPVYPSYYGGGGGKGCHTCGGGGGYGGGGGGSYSYSSSSSHSSAGSFGWGK